MAGVGIGTAQDLTFGFPIGVLGAVVFWGFFQRRRIAASAANSAIRSYEQRAAGAGPGGGGADKSLLAQATPATEPALGAEAAQNGSPAQRAGGSGGPAHAPRAASRESGR